MSSQVFSFSPSNSHSNWAVLRRKRSCPFSCSALVLRRFCSPYIAKMHVMWWGPHFCNFNFDSAEPTADSKMAGVRLGSLKATFLISSKGTFEFRISVASSNTFMASSREVKSLTKGKPLLKRAHKALASSPAHWTPPDACCITKAAVATAAPAAMTPLMLRLPSCAFALSRKQVAHCCWEAVEEVAVRLPKTAMARTPGAEVRRRLENIVAEAKDCFDQFGGEEISRKQ
mmetsp:Transcript_98232/g.204883  ORF Transcript_98232/g.204883 Transcript_98232/m.204883 type:complete len:230 (-) Transcript_98232:29-718(-)